MMIQEIMVSEAVSAEIHEVYAMALEPEDFLRATGELFARCDSAWKQAKKAKTSVDRPIADFLAAGIVHLDALDLCSLSAEMMPAIVSMLISIDMSGVDEKKLGHLFLELHVRMLKACIKFARECSGDDYAEPHANEILFHEASLFVETFGDKKGLTPQVEGLLHGCTHYINDKADRTERPMLRPAERLVDIFARLHAINNY